MTDQACIFCGGPPPLTKEHIFSDWMKPILAKDPRSAFGIEEYAGQVTEQGVTDKRTRRVRSPTELQVRCVCGNCNHGWMNDIETSAKTFMESMLLGQRTELPPEGQQAISTWACLKTIVGQTLQKGRKIAPSDWRRYLFEHHAPPTEWFVGITSYEGQTHAHFESRSYPLVHARSGSANPTIAGEGIHASFLIGYLAIKVFGLRGDGLNYPGADLLLEIWPPSPLILLWPPPIRVDDDAIEEFLRFRRE